MKMRSLAFAVVLATARLATAAELAVNKNGIANTFDGIGNFIPITRAHIHTVTNIDATVLIALLLFVCAYVADQAGSAVVVPQADC